MGEIDAEFIQAVENRPKLKPTEVVDEIPVINLANVLNASHDNAQQVISEIGRACETWGFFQVVNHGVPPELRQRVEAVAKKFFDGSLEEKKKVKREEGKSMGYHDSEYSEKIRDWKEVFDWWLQDPIYLPPLPESDDKEDRSLTNKWPLFPADFREACQEYAREVEKMTFKVLGLISMSLGLPADRLSGYFKDQFSLFRINHYPACPSPNLALGVGPHKDISAITVIAQDDVGGLEVRRKSDAEWVPVKPIPDAYIINLGDIFQVWSNDKYESGEHRVVVNSNKERFSIPLFLFPAHYTTVKPLEELVNEQSPAKYREFNWGKFLVGRHSYSKNQVVEKVQICQFRISA